MAIVEANQLKLHVLSGSGVRRRWVIRVRVNLSRSSSCVVCTTAARRWVLCTWSDVHRIVQHTFLSVSLWILLLLLLLFTLSQSCLSPLDYFLSVSTFVTIAFGAFSAPHISVICIFNFWKVAYIYGTRVHLGERFAKLFPSVQVVSSARIFLR